MNDKNYAPGIDTNKTNSTGSANYAPGIDTSPVENKSVENYAPGIDTIPSKVSSWDDFVNVAKKMSKDAGFPSAVLLGQAALETGRGTSDFAKNRNNYFGMNAIDSNPGEAYHYGSPQASITDYINLITKSPIYAKAWKQYQVDQDPYTLLANIKAAGYATDPNYVQKISSMPEFQNNVLN